jgi:hypothetical protein
MDLLGNQNPPWVAPYLALKAGNSWGIGGGTPANAANLQQGLIWQPPNHCTGEPEEAFLAIKNYT